MTAAKAIAALIGSFITSLLAAGVIPTNSSWHVWLGIVGTIVTAIATYAIPNRPAAPATVVRQ